MNDNATIIRTDQIQYSNVVDTDSSRAMSVGLMVGGLDICRDENGSRRFLSTQDRLLWTLDDLGEIPPIGTPMVKRENPVIVGDYNADNRTITSANMNATSGWINRWTLIRHTESAGDIVHVRWITHVDPASPDVIHLDDVLMEGDGTDELASQSVELIMPPAVDPSMFICVGRQAIPAGRLVEVSLTYSNPLYTPRPLVQTRQIQSNLQFDEQFENRIDDIRIGWVPESVDGQLPPAIQNRVSVNVEALFTGESVKVLFRKPSKMKRVLRHAVGHVNSIPFFESFSRVVKLLTPAITFIAGSRMALVDLPFTFSFEGDAHDPVGYVTLPDGRFVPDTEILDPWAGAEFDAESGQWVKNGVRRVRAYPIADFNALVWDAMTETDEQGIFLPDIFTAC